MKKSKQPRLEDLISNEELWEESIAIYTALGKPAQPHHLPAPPLRASFKFIWHGQAPPNMPTFYDLPHPVSYGWSAILGKYCSPKRTCLKAHSAEQNDSSKMDTRCTTVADPPGMICTCAGAKNAHSQGGWDWADGSGY
jgi:hypothetical protein